MEAHQDRFPRRRGEAGVRLPACHAAGARCARRARLVGDSNNVEAYSKRWLRNRERVGVKSWKDDDSRLRHHILPLLGKMPLPEVQPRHVNELIQRVRAARKAPRTVRNIYSVVQAMFRDAQIDGLVSSNPCILTKYQLGRKADAKREWRAGAIFSREELQDLVGDER